MPAQQVFDTYVSASDGVVLTSDRSSVISGQLYSGLARGIDFAGYNVGTKVTGCYFGTCTTGIAIGTGTTNNDSELVVEDCFFVSCTTGISTGHNQTKNNVIRGCKFSQCTTAFYINGATPVVFGGGVWGGTIIDAPNNATNRCAFFGLDSEALVRIGDIGTTLHGIKTPWSFTGCQFTFDYATPPANHLSSVSSLITFRDCEFNGYIPSGAGQLIVDTDMPVMFDRCTFLEDSNGGDPVLNNGTGGLIFNSCVTRDLLEPSGYRVFSA